MRRPAPPHAAAVHRYLLCLRDVGFHGSPAPRRLRTDEGWEELEFLHGEVAVPPYPAWSLTDEAMGGVGRLLRRYHGASAKVPVDAEVVTWPTDLADPEGGSLLCHNDVCPENVVFRDGRATALIDFDFAAPGRPVWDLAMTARYWAPIMDPVSADVSGRGHLDAARRVQVIVDAYGLAADLRPGFISVVQQVLQVARSFVARRVDDSVPAFVAAFEAHGGWERWDRVDAWVAEHRAELTPD